MQKFSVQICPDTKLIALSFQTKKKNKDKVYLVPSTSNMIGTTEKSDDAFVFKFDLKGAITTPENIVPPV